MKTCKSLLLCAAVAILAATAATAQPPAPQTPAVPAAAPSQPALAMFGFGGAKSPEVGADGSVTFRLTAQDATSVSVTGNWLSGATSPPVAMTKGDKGVWEVTVSGLKPEMWTYNFVVDGVRMLDPGNVNIMRDGVRFMNFVTIPGTGSELYAANDVPHGTVHQVWYPSPSLKLTERRMYVYTPAGYEGSQQRYPVLYLMHGVGGDEDAWDNMGRAREIFDNLIASGKAKPLIVVMTNGNWNQTAAPGVSQQAASRVSFGGDPAARNTMMTVMMSFSDSIVPDVIPFVDKNYRTIADRDHRAIAGLSMGGAQSLYGGLRHLDQFSYVASFSGAMVMLPGVLKAPPVPSAAPRAPGTGQEIDASALPADFPGLDASANQKLHLLYISCGENDGLLTSNQQFMDWLTSQGITYKKMLLPGYAHEWPFWRISLANLLPQLF